MQVLELVFLSNLEQSEGLLESSFVEHYFAFDIFSLEELTHDAFYLVHLFFLEALVGVVYLVKVLGYLFI